MKKLLPHFILDKYRNNEKHGTFQAYTMFVDLSGFTQLTNTLLQQGNSGAEQLSNILNSIFAPMVQEVYQRGGFIPYFAGDAFTAIFEEKENIETAILLETAQTVQAFFQKNDSTFGNFRIGIKIGLSYGNVEWGIVGDDFKSWYFRGVAIDQSAESHKYASQEDIVIDHLLKEKLPNDYILKPALNPRFFILEAWSKDFDTAAISKSDFYDKKTLANDTAKIFLPEAVLQYNQIGEFREVIAIFISFKGIDTHELLNTFVSIVLHHINSFSGYFKEVDFGDKGGVLCAFFGAPVTFENNIERALEFILSVKDDLKPLQKESNLQFRAGITSGTAFTGLVGGAERSQYAAVGNTVNLAARLMTFANWGEVLVDKEIQKSRYFEFKDKGDIHYKGFKGNISTYLLDGRDLQDSPTFEGKMVGRNQELLQLMNWIKPVVTQQKSGLAYVFGEAGIGKSRMAFELRKTLKEQSRFHWFTCQADQILKKPFNPFVYFLKSYFDQSPNQSGRVNRTNFEENFEGLLSDIQKSKHAEAPKIHKELIRTKSILAALLGLQTEPESLWQQLGAKGRYQNILAALSNIIAAETVMAPLILELEDGHWYDQNSKEFLEDFLKKAKQYPIFFLVTSRYRDDGTKPFLFSKEVLNKYGFQRREIDLNTLQPAGLKAFAEAKLEGTISDDLHALLVRTTNGNPFYLEQLLEYFSESRLLTVVDDIWNIKDTNIKMSGSINSILMARIDRLSILVKETVKAAAVIGQEFEIPVLSEIIRTQQDFVIRNGNMQLVLKEQVKTAEEVQIWRAMNELRYIFKHSLLREAAYGMQLHTRLIELHRMIGEAIEKIYPDSLEQRYVDLAFHFEQAEEEAKTRHYLEKAGEYAQRNYQNQQALEFFDKLLSRLKGASYRKKKVEILLKKGGILEMIGHWSNCERLYREALGLAQRIKHKYLISLTNNNLGRLLMLKGSYTEARSYLEKSAQLFAALKNKTAEAKAHGDLGNLYFRQGKYEQAKAYFTQSIEARDLHRYTDVNAQIVANLGLTHMNQGNYEEGIRWQKLQLEICKAANDKKGMATLYTNMGIVYFESGDYDNALDCYEKGLALSEELGNKQLTAIAIGCIGSVYERKGDYEKAMFNFEKDLELCEQLGDKQGIAIALGLIGELLSVEGEFDKSIAYLQKNLMFCKELNYRKGVAKALNTLGDVYYYLKIYDRSADFYEQAIQLTREIDNKLVLGFSLVEKGRTLMKKGDLDNIFTLTDEALLLAMELGNPDLLFEAKILQARVNHRLGNNSEAFAILQTLLLEKLQEPEEAAIYYHLYEIEKTEEFRKKAIVLYEKLYAVTPKYSYRVRLEKLKS